MSEPLQTDPEEMTTTSGQFVGLKQSFDRAGGGLANGLEVLGDFAGNDNFGNLFKKVFNPAITNLVNSFYGLGNGMDGTATSLKDSAELYNKSDQVNAESVPDPTSAPRGG